MFPFFTFLSRELKAQLWLTGYLRCSMTLMPLVQIVLFHLWLFCSWYWLFLNQCTALMNGVYSVWKEWWVKFFLKNLWVYVPTNWAECLSVASCIWSHVSSYQFCYSNYYKTNFNDIFSLKKKAWGKNQLSKRIPNSDCFENILCTSFILRKPKLKITDSGGLRVWPIFKENIFNPIFKYWWMNIYLYI